MATTLEYALFSANVYGNSEAVRREQNTLPAPDGWTALTRVVLPAGFMATAYQRGTEIVISYAGTTDENLLDWLTGNVPAATAATLAPQVLDAAKFYLDVLAANPTASITFTGHSLGGGLASLMAVFFDKHAAVFDEAPFQKSADSATVVNALKAGLVALGYSLPTELLGYVALDPTGALIPSPTRVAREGRVDQTYVNGEALSIASTALTNFISVALGTINPALWVLGTGVDKVNGTETVVDPNAQTMLGWGPLIPGTQTPLAGVSGNPVDLHSVTLLTGFLQSPQFLATVRAHPELLPRLFAGLFKNDPKRDEANLVELLVQREYRGESSLGALATDVDKIDLANGLTSVTELPTESGVPTKISVASLLVDAVLSSLYGQGKDRDPSQTGLAQFQTVLRNITGGLTVDLSAFAADAVERELGALLNALIGQGSIGAATSRHARWTLQSGSTSLNASQETDSQADIMLAYTGNDSMSSGAGDDVLAGYGGADTLNGGNGFDMLYGGDGADTLDGGANGDWLQGGAGTDTYTFSGLFGSDVVEDAGGAGSIVVTGLGNIDGSSAKKTSPTSSTWQSDDRKITYAVVTLGTAAAPRKDLIIDIADGSANAGRITVRNWSDGQLGISLGSEVVAPNTTAPFIGDYAKVINGETYWIGANGNYWNDGAPQANAADLLNGSSAADLMQGLGGNDGLAGGSGDDVIEGGAGDDLLLGGWGADTIRGGDGADQVFGSDSGQFSMPLQVGFTPPAATGVEIARGFNWVVFDPPGLDGSGIDAYTVAGGGNILPNGEPMGNLIDGDAGDDRIAAGTGADVVQAGADNDVVWGMGGADVIAGEAGNDKLWGDGSQIRGGIAYANYTPLQYHGDDAIDGGAGDDQLIGQGGDDALYGGADNDLMWGDGSDALDEPAALHGADWLDGGSGADELVGGGNDDVLFGGSDNDKLRGDDVESVVAAVYQGQDYLDGEDGDDQLNGGGNADVLIGGLGADTMLGDDVQSKLASSAHGDDFMDGGAGDDLMAGSGGDDECGAVWVTTSCKVTTSRPTSRRLPTATIGSMAAMATTAWRAAAAATACSATTASTRSTVTMRGPMCRARSTTPTGSTAVQARTCCGAAARPMCSMAARATTSCWAMP